MKKSIFLKIPKEKLKESLLLKKSFLQKLIVFTCNGQKITLQGERREYDRLKEHIVSNQII